MCDKTSKPHNDFLGFYCHKYNELSDDKKESKYNPKNLFLMDMIIMCGHRMKKN